MRNVLLLAATSICLLSAACRTAPQNGAQVAEDGDDPWAKQAWISKAAKALLYGSTGLSAAETDQLMPLSKEAIVDQFMNDPRFYETALDFNLYFLGLKQEKLRNYYEPDGGYKSEVFSNRAAAVSAVELARNGDYFSIFNWNMPYTLVGGPTSPDALESTNAPNSPTIVASDEVRRAHWLELAEQNLDAWIAEIEASTDVKALCKRYVKGAGDDEKEDFLDYLDKVGLPAELRSALDKSNRNQLLCGIFTGHISPSIKADLLSEAKSLKTSLQALPALIAGLHTKIKSPADLNMLTAAMMPMRSAEGAEAFSPIFWNSLINSSTNFNRKRAAYILKTFFCDNLTPLNIAAPVQHTESRHASDAACQACHYKLDPMAGFFRDRGVAGINFDTLPFHLHDDLFQREGQELAKYLASWKAPLGGPREWDVGYIRSATNASLNAYGSTLVDLFRIIRDARESKICLTKRLAEYVLGTGQIYDGQWIDYLAKDFIEAGKPQAAPGDSSKAFKKAMKSLLLSRTFAHPDPAKGTCYDFAPDTEPSGLPCEVAHIIEKNCTTCHAGEGAPKGLDLSKWKVFSGGQSGFAHVDDRTGQQLATGASLARIACALSPTDQCPRSQLMPYNQDMDAVERATLYKWTQNELSGASR